MRLDPITAAACRSMRTDNQGQAGRNVSMPRADLMTVGVAAGGIASWPQRAGPKRGFGMFLAGFKDFELVIS